MRTFTLHINKQKHQHKQQYYTYVTFPYHNTICHSSKPKYVSKKQLFLDFGGRSKNVKKFGKFWLQLISLN